MSEENKPMDRELKNMIFSAKEAGDKAKSGTQDVPAIEASKAAQKEFGFEIPVNAVPIPSRGLLYPPGHPLHNAESVEYRAMTAREEDILMSQALIKKGTVIDELIRACVTNKDIDPASLLSGDRTAIMVAIRASGYGSRYVAETNCPQCKAKNKVETRLTDLPLNMLDLEPVEPGENLFEFKLPESKRVVNFKFLTVEDENILVKDMNARKKRGFQNQKLITSRLLRSIVSLDGDKNKGNIAKFVEFMPAIDSMKLRQYIDDHEPGVDMTIDFTCLSCDYDDLIQMPIGTAFFWPNAE